MHQNEVRLRMRGQQTTEVTARNVRERHAAVARVVTGVYFDGQTIFPGQVCAQLQTPVTKNQPVLHLRVLRVPEVPRQRMDGVLPLSPAPSQRSRVGVAGSCKPLPLHRTL